MADDAVLDTYRYLRGGMAVTIVMLATGVLLEWLHAGCWQTSISAYYFTSAHAVFIAALCVVGALLIVYKGNNDTEDVLLNLAGILAFIVAMVPTSRPLQGCTGVDPNIGTRSALLNIWAVVIALAVSRVASEIMYRHTGTRRSRSAIGTAAVWVQRALLAVGVGTLALAPQWFRTNAHGIAAVATFGSIILTVAIAAFVTGDNRRYQLIYRGISAIMVLTLVTVVCLHQLLDGFNHAVIVVEAALIAEFAVYWMVQTVELWGTPTRTTAAGGRFLRAL